MRLGKGANTVDTETEARRGLEHGSISTRYPRLWRLGSGRKRVEYIRSKSWEEKLDGMLARRGEEGRVLSKTFHYLFTLLLRPTVASQQHSNRGKDSNPPKSSKAYIPIHSSTLLVG